MNPFHVNKILRKPKPFTVLNQNAEIHALSEFFMRGGRQGGPRVESNRVLRVHPPQGGPFFATLRQSSDILAGDNHSIIMIRVNHLHQTF